MKKLFVLLSSIVVSSTINAQLFTDDFDSYMDTADLKNSWTGFGYALDGEIYISNAGGTDSSQAVIYVGNWKKGAFLGAVYAMKNENLTSARSVSVDVSFETNRFVQEPATAPSEFRLGIEGSNGDIWESRVNLKLADDGSMTNYTLDILRSKMWKQVNKTGSGSLLDALASVSGVRLIFTNNGNVGVQDFVFDNFTILP
jgi:hypothetical protein